MSTAALNPADLAYAAGIRSRPPLPFVPGLEGVGLSAAGERVYFSPTVAPHGSFAELAVAGTGSTFVLPPEVTDEMALCLGVAGTTAWTALTDKAQLQPGESVLVLGATGAVGQIAVQAAKTLGADRVVAAGRDRATLDRLRSRGADDVVVLEGAYGDALTAAGGQGFDVVIDSLFGEPMVAAIRATRLGGRIVNLGMRAGRTAELPGVAMKGRDLLSCSMDLVSFPDQHAALATLCGHALAGRIVLEHDRTPLADIAETWSRQAARPHCKLLVAI